MKRNHSSNNKRFYLFERCSGGILNMKFDSNELESFYNECVFPRSRGRFRFVCIFNLLVGISWLLFFANNRPLYLQFSINWCYVLGFSIMIILSFLAFLISFFKRLFTTYYLLICWVYSFCSCLLALTTFFPSFPSASLAFNLSLVVNLLLIIYTMVPLRLWQLLIICGPLSLLHVTLSCVRYETLKFPLALTEIVANLWIHLVGITLSLMSEVLRRSTFLRLCHNALMSKALKKEQDIRDDMICSLMPRQVAQKVMSDVAGDSVMDEADESKIDYGVTEGSSRKCGENCGSFCLSNKYTDRFGMYNEDPSIDEDEPNVTSLPSDSKVVIPVDNLNIGACSSESAALTKTAAPPRAVTFRKFHVSQLENVSVLFADIVGFTKMSSNKTASHLVYLLNDLFGRFDNLCAKIGCEKIATLGDCYYCVSGCPNPVDNHAEMAVEMGRAMCLAIQQFDLEHNEEVNMRVGVHTGKVICGIVGTRRFKFDVWSNDVTLANEMESSGQAGKVHISEATLGFVKDIYEVCEGDPVQDIRKFKVLVEFFNREEQCFAIKHTQDEAMIKTYFIENRIDGKPVVSLSRGTIVPGTASTDVELSNVEKPALNIYQDYQLASDPNVPVESSSVEAPFIEAVSTSLNDIPKQQNLDLNKADLKTSDFEMLQTLQELVSVDEVFEFPPISRVTLNFRNTFVEYSYRRLGVHRPRGLAAKNITWSTPRIEPLVNAAVQTVLFIILIITCLIAFPDCRLATQMVFYFVLGFSILIHVAFLGLLFVDFIAWSSPISIKIRPHSAWSVFWRQSVTQTYLYCFTWCARNLIGAVFLLLPTVLILSCFSGSFFSHVKYYSHLFVAHYRLQFGLLYTFMLVNLTLFISFSFWTKLLSALFVCLLATLLIFLPATIFSPQQDIFEHTWKSYSAFDTITNWSQSTTHVWLKPVLGFNFQWELFIILVLSLILIAALSREMDISSRLSFYREYEALQAKRAIAQQKVQADWLLENIIPSYIMDDLRQTNKYSQHIVDAGVLFACISNFSEFYDEQYQGGQEMLRVLNEIFADFEHQLSLIKYKDVEKIKTIGACFMSASGLNMTERDRNTNLEAHLWALVDFALDLLHTLDEFNRQMFNFQFEMKVGYNIGEVTAGVIGTTKLLYDIWGDTVNVASRMYSTGQKSRIQVTEVVAKRLETRYLFEYRGEVAVKGKGNMRTYLLVGRRTE